MNNNLFPYRHHIGYVDRNQRNGHRSIVVWFTGLSGSGKTTIAKPWKKYYLKEDITLTF